MRQSIRALGWASRILWIAAAAFMVTALYSPLKLMLERQVAIGSPQASFSNQTITLSIPFFINNTGFYDLSDLDVTTSVADYNGTLIVTSTTFVKDIPRGKSVNKTHAVSIGIDDIISRNLTYLLFDDATIFLDQSVGLTIAHVIPLQVSTIVNMFWGAPLYNPYITIMNPPAPYNSTHYSTIAGLSFENHSPFDMDGMLTLEIFNEGEEPLGIWIGQISASSGEEYDETVPIYIPSASISRFSGRGEVHAHFESPMGSLDWWFTYG